MLEDNGGMDRSLAIIVGVFVSMYFILYEDPAWYSVTICAVTAFLIYKRIQIMKVALSPQVQLIKTDLVDIKNELKRMAGVK